MESKIEKTRLIEKVRNMKERKGDELAGTVS
jgi:hypothetical protein